MRISNNALLLILMLITLTEANSQSTATKNVTHFTIESSQLGQRKIWIWLPDGYSSSRQKYPVIYMHDAQNLFDKTTSYAGEWQVDETLDSLKAKVIVVGIEHGNERRLDELTPFANPKHGGGKADDYLDFLINTLKPRIDKDYRTKTGARNTAIFGSSLGGLTSYYAVLKFPNVFGKAGVFSPSFWYSNDIYKLTEDTKKICSKVYFLAGDSESQDMVKDLDQMFALVKVRGRESELSKNIVIGGKHNEQLWRESFAKAYLWLFP